MKGIKLIIGKILASLCWRLLYALRNKRRLQLSREEIRQMKISFSQFGEDLIVLSYFGGENPKKNGIYVDVGAFDPVCLSTTLLLYKLGWTGINIDMDSEKIEKYRNMRPRDCNIAAAISNTQKKMLHLKYPLGATNRIVDVTEAERLSLCKEVPIQTKEVITEMLTTLIDKSPFSGKQIDYLNVDCEGHDYEVLTSLDFSRYKPTIITIEAFSTEERQRLESFLIPHGYRCDATLRHTLLFVRQ